MIDVILIAAVSENNVIGIEKKLPWNIPEDLKHFKELTEYHPVIMGRRTYESIGKPLKNRFNIVLSRKFTFPGIMTARNLQEAINMASYIKNKAYVIGGEQVYKKSINIATRLEITRVHQTIEGDRFFPEITEEWKLTTNLTMNGYSFRTYMKK